MYIKLRVFKNRYVFYLKVDHFSYSFKMADKIKILAICQHNAKHSNHTNLVTHFFQLQLVLEQTKNPKIYVLLLNLPITLGKQHDWTRPFLPNNIKQINNFRLFSKKVKSSTPCCWRFRFSFVDYLLSVWSIRLLVHCYNCTFCCTEFRDIPILRLY